ncbi:alkane 1-monooxygenase [Nannocystaceae bacterium ST9]
MTRVAPYFLAFMMPALVLLGVELGGVWTLMPLVLVFGAIPLLDALVGLDTLNREEMAPAARWRFDLPLLLWVPVQIGTTLWVVVRLASGEFSTGEIVGLTITLGVINGAGGINIAHELMHRKARLHRAAAEILMSSVHYTHFCVEHVLGHHRHVATEQDAASSRFGETLYRFLPRTLAQSLTSAWRLERDRCARQGIAWYDLRDRRFRYLLVLALVDLTIGLTLGGVALAVFVGQGVVAFVLLETINYIEHYGLARRRLASGNYERVQPHHSWNSAHRVSNWYLFNLQRHSDHHYLASREYDRLRHYEDVPQLPAGYATMVVVALIPPLWFRIMDPRVSAWNSKVGESAVATTLASAT